MAWLNLCDIKLFLLDIKLYKLKGIDMQELHTRIIKSVCVNFKDCDFYPSIEIMLI